MQLLNYAILRLHIVITVAPPVAAEGVEIVHDESGEALDGRHPPLPEHGQQSSRAPHQDVAPAWGARGVLLSNCSMNQQ